MTTPTPEVLGVGDFSTIGFSGSGDLQWWTGCGLGNYALLMGAVSGYASTAAYYTNLYWALVDCSGNTPVPVNQGTFVNAVPEGVFGWPEGDTQHDDQGSSWGADASPLVAIDDTHAVVVVQGWDGSVPTYWRSRAFLLTLTGTTVSISAPIDLYYTNVLMTMTGSGQPSAAYAIAAKTSTNRVRTWLHYAQTTGSSNYWLLTVDIVYDPTTNSISVGSAAYHTSSTAFPSTPSIFYDLRAAGFSDGSSVDVTGNFLQHEDTFGSLSPVAINGSTVPHGTRIASNGGTRGYLASYSSTGTRYAFDPTTYVFTSGAVPGSDLTLDYDMQIAEGQGPSAGYVFELLAYSYTTSDGPYARWVQIPSSGAPLPGSELGPIAVPATVTPRAGMLWAGIYNTWKTVSLGNGKILDLATAILFKGLGVTIPPGLRMTQRNDPNGVRPSARMSTQGGVGRQPTSVQLSAYPRISQRDGSGSSSTYA